LFQIYKSGYVSAEVNTLPKIVIILYLAGYCLHQG
jgi:hypothetical protein